MERFKCKNSPIKVYIHTVEGQIISPLINLTVCPLKQKKYVNFTVRPKYVITLSCTLRYPNKRLCPNLAQAFVVYTMNWTFSFYVCTRALYVQACWAIARMISSGGGFSFPVFQSREASLSKHSLARTHLLSHSWVFLELRSK